MIKVRFYTCNFTKAIALIICCCFFQGSEYVIDASQNAAIHNNQGVTFLHDHDYIPAISEFKIAIALAPNKPATANYYNNLGLAYNSIKRYEWGQLVFERAVEINPNFFEYYKNLVKTYKLRNTLYKNLSKYSKRIEYNKGNSICWLFKGLIYEELGMKSAAVDSYIKYMKLEPDMLLTEAVSKNLYEITQNK